MAERKKGTRLSPELLSEVKAYFENHQLQPKPSAVCEKFGITSVQLNYHSKKNQWYPAWKTKQKTEKLYSKKLDALVEEEAENESEKMLKQAREVVHDVTAMSLKRFKDSDPEIKDFHEATRAYDLLERSLGVKEDAGAKIGLQIGFLSSPQVIEV